jgi:mannan endo-1,4-beta-mannosidase
VVNVNGVRSSGHFQRTRDPRFAPHAAGRVELSEGANTLTIEKGWGYYEIDAIELRPAAPPAPPAKPPVTLSDRSAMPEARQLYARLIDSYGERAYSGVYSGEDLAHVVKITGRVPAILGGDLMDYSPSRLERGADPKRTVEDLIAAARERGLILTLSWHWNAPNGLIDREITTEDGRKVNALWYKGFNTNATTFDLGKALSDASSSEYRLLLRDIDAIAVQLRKLSDARVPVLWRPLHEAEGGWFWWGAKGPEPFVKLWRLMFERLTQHHGLHNLIWVYTGGPDRAWYPGDDCVDVVGIDAYPPDGRDPLSGTWDDVLRQYAARKPIALTEVGGVPDIDRMRRFGVYWAYWTSWTAHQGPQAVKPDDLKRIYTSPQVINAPVVKQR